MKDLYTRAMILRPIVFMLILAWTCLAQLDQGQIAGTVLDPAGNPVPGAAISIQQAQTRRTTEAASGANGAFLFASLPIGLYRLDVEAPGFKRFSRETIKVDASNRTAIEVRLEIGAVSETITVEGQAAVLQEETAQIGRVVESRQISDLALNGRNPLNLALLKPGVVGGNFNSFNPVDVFSSFSVNGGQRNGTLITIDGAPAVRTRGDNNGAGIIGIFNTDTIQEVQILTSTYPAEYGRAMDGQIRFVTKSGSRDFHGTLWNFLRNSALDANSWVRNQSTNRDDSRRPAPFRFNQPGYAIGGPVWIPKTFNTKRDRLYFFVSQEWVSFRREQTSVGTVPSLAMRGGDFSELLSAANPFFRRVLTVRDPDAGAPFPNNVIPTSRLSKNGSGMLRAYPAPVPGYQQGTNNWIQSRPNPRETRKDLFRVDYYLGPHRVSFSGQNFTYGEDAPFRGNFDVANTRWDRPNRTGAFSVTSTLSPKLINDASFTAANDVVRMTLYPTAGEELFRRGRYGIDFPYLIPGPKTIEDRIPTIAVTGLTSLDGSSKPGTSSGPIYTWNENLTWIANPAHTLKFGLMFERAEQNNNDQIAFNQNGWFTFLDTGHPRTTGVALGNAALGLLDGYFEIGPAAYTQMRSNAIEIYAQDNWRVNRRLTLELGARYAYHQPWYAVWNDISNFDSRFYETSRRAALDPRTGAIVSGDPYNGIVLAGNEFPASARGRALGATLPNVQRLFRDQPRGFTSPNGIAIAPRFGAAYKITERTVARAGFGAFHHRPMLLNGTLFRNAPNQPRVDVQFGDADRMGAGGTRDFPFTLGALDLKLRYPVAYSYSFSVQHQLPGAVVIDVAYVGKSAANLERIRNINQMQPGTIQRNPGINPNALRPWLGLATVNLNERTGRSRYDSLQISVDRRFTRNLGFGVAYTFSKALDNIATPYNAFRFQRALSVTDRPHVLTANFIYELPLFRAQKGAAGLALGGWQISGVTFYRSGVPLSVTDSTDMAGVGPGSAAQVWNVAGSPAISGDRGIGLPWFNRGAFTMPAQGTFGNAGLNIIRGPRFSNWDLALFKNIRVHERVSAQFRLEAFNFSNTPVLDNPGVNPRAGNFSLVTSKSNERNLQLGLKLIF